MRRIGTLIMLALGLNGFTQPDNGVAASPLTTRFEEKTGSVSGRVTTVDGQPAAYVTITVKALSKTTTTDESGYFILGGFKEGTHVLEISMVGLKPVEVEAFVKADRITVVNVALTEDARQLHEVVVSTGRRLNNKALSIGKIEIAPMDLPQSLTVVGQGIIREQQAQRLGDVLRNVNGVYVTTTRGAVQESFGARGYSFGSTNLFKNGSRINSGVLPEMSSLEKVEVLKGSAAILYGQVAPGGILNMVTKQPKFNAGGEVSVRAGSYDLYKPAFDVYGPLSSTLAYRVNGTHEKAGSYRDGVNSERYYINPSLLFRLSDKTEVVAEGDFLQHRFTPDFGIGTLDGTQIPAVARSAFFGTSWQYNKIQQTTATLTLRQRFNERWKLNASLAYQIYNRDYYGVERIQASANGDWTRPLGKIFMDETYYTGQVNLVGKLQTGGWEHNLLAGLDADQTATDNNDFSFANGGFGAGNYDRINLLNSTKYTPRTDMPAATAVRRREADLNRFGVYVQDLIKLSSKFNLQLGGRWSYVETAGIDSTNLLTGTKTRGKARFDNAFLPRAGLVYKPSEATSVFASYSTSFTVNTGQDIYGAALAPSLIDQYELGVKNEFWNGKLSANATLYRIVNSNLAQTAPYLLNGFANSNTAIKMLSGETVSDGIEIDLATHPWRGLDVTAGYSYNFMRYTKTDTAVGSFKTGERLVNNPAHTANLSAFYSFGSGVLKGVKAGITAAYTGDRFGGWNTDVLSTNPVKYRSRIFPVEGFTTIDFSLGYAWKKFSVLTKISNVTNELNYYVHENYSINPIPPTQFVATAAYRF